MGGAVIGGRRPLKGRKAGDRRVRVERPHGSDHQEEVRGGDERRNEEDGAEEKPSDLSTTCEVGLSITDDNRSGAQADAQLEDRRPGAGSIGLPEQLPDRTSAREWVRLGREEEDRRGPECDLEGSEPRCTDGQPGQGSPSARDEPSVREREQGEPRCEERHGQDPGARHHTQGAAGPARGNVVGGDDQERGQDALGHAGRDPDPAEAIARDPASGPMP